VGTEKRERQKANRAMKQQQEAKAETRQRGVRIGVIVVGAIVGVFGLAWIASTVLGDDDASPTDTLPELAEPVDSLVGANDDVDVTDDSVLDPVVDQEPDPEAVAPVECPPAEGATEPVQSFDQAPPLCLDPGVVYQALVTTNFGEFTIELDQERAPETVNNFVFLARNLYYDNTPCHRIIPDFVVQCGDPTGSGTGGPGYEFDDEVPAEGEYRIGSVTMANSGPNTNGSQWFVVTGAEGEALPPLYSLFGQVTDGLDTTVAELAELGSPDGTPTEPVEIISVVITAT
jgi:cyclophilin family peptidyl-prolyl cis-trans isomerase